MGLRPQKSLCTYGRPPFSGPCNMFIFPCGKFSGLVRGWVAPNRRKARIPPLPPVSLSTPLLHSPGAQAAGLGPCEVQAAEKSTSPLFEVSEPTAASTRLQYAPCPDRHAPCGMGSHGPFTQPNDRKPQGTLEASGPQAHRAGSLSHSVPPLHSGAGGLIGPQVSGPQLHFRLFLPGRQFPGTISALAETHPLLEGAARAVRTVQQGMCLPLHPLALMRVQDFGPCSAAWRTTQCTLRTQCARCVGDSRLVHPPWCGHSVVNGPVEASWLH